MSVEGKKSNNNLPDTQNSLTHSYTLKHSSTHRREGFRELGHVKFCSSLFLIDCSSSGRKQEGRFKAALVI